MIRHILKLMWNRKRSLAWIFIEQILVFAVMLWSFIILVEPIRHSCFVMGNRKNGEKILSLHRFGVQFPIGKILNYGFNR